MSLGNPPIIYVHGFASSGHSAKGQLLRTHLPRVFTPSLSHIPQLAMEMLECLLDALPEKPLLVGSSLGGLYAHYLSARHQLPAVLVNPALAVNAPLRQVIGMNHHCFDGSRFEFTEAHLKSLAEYAATHPQPERLLVLLQMGDELLDHRRTVEALKNARLVVEQGGSHGFDNFEEKLPLIRRFAAENLLKSPSTPPGEAIG